LGVIASAPQWQRLVTLAPVFVIGAGLVLAVFILLGRGLATSIRESGHKRLILSGFGVLAVLVVVLTYLGVELPKEG
jgi:ABC-type enterobactin transport system permease subunit